MSKNRQALVEIERRVTGGAWWAYYTVSYRGKTVHQGRSYMGSITDHGKERRDLRRALNQATDWALDHGFTGIRASGYAPIR